MTFRNRCASPAPPLLCAGALLLTLCGGFVSGCAPKAEEKLTDGNGNPIAPLGSPGNEMKPVNSRMADKATVGGGMAAGATTKARTRERPAR